MKLNIKAFALTAGIFWGLGLFFITWWILFLEGSEPDALMFARLYPGYSISPAGSCIGFAWAFFDGLIGGALFSWIYNRLAGSASASAEMAAG